MDRECCGTCRFHMPYKFCGERGWLCNNPDADEYGLETEYGYVCEDYEEGE